MSINEKIEALREGIGAALIRYCSKNSHLQSRNEAISLDTRTIDYSIDNEVNLSNCGSVDFVDAADDEFGFIVVLRINGTHEITYRSDDTSIMTAVIAGMMMEG